MEKHEADCMNCKDKQACVPFFIHENAMMHKDWDNERMERIVKGQKVANIIQSVVILLIAIFRGRCFLWHGSPLRLPVSYQKLYCSISALLRYRTKQR